MDGGCLPHWDEALDESTGIIEAVHFAPYLYGGEAPPITSLQNTQPVKLSVSLIGLTINQIFA